MNILAKAFQAIEEQRKKASGEIPGAKQLKSMISLFPELTESQKDPACATLSFRRERSFRGNARNFKIMMDNREVARIAPEGYSHVLADPGIHSLHIKLDTMNSTLLNIQVEAGKRYYYDIICTMNEGLVLQAIKDE